MVKRFDKVAAERNCRERLRELLGREPSEKELAEAVKLARDAWNDTGRVVDAVLKRT